MSMAADQAIEVIYLEVAQDSLPACLQILPSLHVERFREIGQAHRFVILQGRTGSEGSVDLDSLPGLLAPADRRLHRPYDVQPSLPMSPSDLIVLTHIDVPPPCLPALEALYRPFMAASRAEAGATCCDLLQSPTRPNHFTLVECWASEDAAWAHAKAAHTLDFRRQLTPLLGALYDQRFYRLLP